jgi:hypothetical protein
MFHFIFQHLIEFLTILFMKIEMEKAINFIGYINQYLDKYKIKLEFKDNDEYESIKFILYSEENISSIECCLVDNYVGIESFTYPLFRKQGFNLLMRYIVVLFTEYLSKITNIDYEIYSTPSNPISKYIIIKHFDCKLIDGGDILIYSNQNNFKKAREYVNNFI